MYAPWTARIDTSIEIREPRMSGPARLASTIAASAPSRARIASVAAARTATITSPAPIAAAAISAPSRTANGLRSSSTRSVADDGSAP
jgi:hypothetical protein